MTVEQARAAYAAYAELGPLYADQCYRWPGVCDPCRRFHQRTDAASLSLDLAVAVRHRTSGGPTPRQLGEEPHP
jgi:hypothetical protein